MSVVELLIRIISPFNGLTKALICRAYEESKLLVILVTCIFAANCTNNQLVPSLVTLEPSRVEIMEGESFALNVNVYPEGAADNNLIWSSSNLSVATIESGVVKGIKPGTAIISVKTKDGVITARCEVIVRPMELVTILDVHTTATTISLNGKVNVPLQDLASMNIKLAYCRCDSFGENSAEASLVAQLDHEGFFSIKMRNLSYGTKYYYHLILNDKFGDIISRNFSFVTDDIEVELTNEDAVVLTEYAYRARFTGIVKGISDEDEGYVEVGVAYSSSLEDPQSFIEKEADLSTINANGRFSLYVVGLEINHTYYYRYYIRDKDDTYYGEINKMEIWHPYSYHPDLDGALAIDLSYSGSANCYIVSESDIYKFKLVKGNSTEEIQDVHSCEVLWESLNTDVKPKLGDLIGGGVCCKDGYVIFQTSPQFKEGNAVIVAKSEDGNILWSWHIWFTDYPKSQVYRRNAGVMMDRNLGAISATPGDVGSLGLLYQWGRKDPFLGSSSINSYAEPESTIKWPNYIWTDAEIGTIAYSILNPTVRIRGNNDWLYTEDGTFENDRWTPSSKSMYDPCPPGWRVPSGGNDGVWSKALGFAYGVNIKGLYDSENCGWNFYSRFSNDSSVWYPIVRFRSQNGTLNPDLMQMAYWSSKEAYVLYFDAMGNMTTVDTEPRDAILAVRCLKE